MNTRTHKNMPTSCMKFPCPFPKFSDGTCTKCLSPIDKLVFRIHPHPLPPPQVIEGDSNCGTGNRTLLLFPFANQPNKTDQETQTQSLHTNQVTHQASAYPVVSSMK